MNGRLEKEIRAKKAMDNKLTSLPSVFKEFYSYLDAEGKSYTTSNNYINHNIDFMNYINENYSEGTFYRDVKATHVNNYMSSIRLKEVNGEMKRTGDEIRAARWTSINAFFNFLKSYDYIVDNPLEKTNRPKIKTEHKVTYLSKKEINIVLKEVKNKATEKKLSRDLCLMSLALSTGLRVSAITQINVDDINFENKTIKVIEKGDKTRYINFGDNLKELIVKCIEDREKSFSNITTDALFVSQWGKRMTTQAVRDLVTKYTSVIKGKHITPHKLRASTAMNLHGSGVDLLTIASILGHENVTTTQRYTQAYDDKKADAAKILDGLI
jgi:site-specific recombinase XerD